MNNDQNWSGQWRRDGLTIVVSPETGMFIVLPGDDRPAIDHCPCCDKTLTRQAAMFVADAVYPLRVEGRP